jgi:hypothetical protein
MVLSIIDLGLGLSLSLRTLQPAAHHPLFLSLTLVQLL